MKTVLVAATLAALAAFNLSPASAGQYSPPAASSGTGHWEWQYHYAGHHPRYQGYWAWVK
jgi:hypothetical protein